MRNKFNQFLLAFYISYFALSKFLIHQLPFDQFYVMFIPTFLMLAVSLCVNMGNGKLQKVPITTILLTLLLLVLSMVYFRNNSVFGYSYDFLISGAIPLLLLMRIDTVDSFFKYFAYFSIATVLLLGLDPTNGYILTGDYMIYGYRVMLPAFAGLYISRKYYGLNWLLPFETIAIALLIAFGNQGATVSAIALVVLCNLFIDKLTKKKLALISIAVFALATLALNIKPALEWGITETQKSGNTSYSLEKMYGSLYGNTDGLSGRTYYWEKAVVMYNNKPLLGNGIGAFESVNGIYSHNIILEIAVSVGIVGVLLFVAYMAYYISCMLRATRDKRLLYALGIGIGLTPLFFSMQPFMWYYFWIFITIPWIKTRMPERKKHSDEYNRKAVTVELKLRKSAYIIDRGCNQETT